MLARSKDMGEYFFKLCLTELYYSAMLSEFICSLGWLLTNNLTKPHPDGYYRYWAWSQLLLLECAGFNFFLLEWAGCKPASAGCCQITEPFDPLAPTPCPLHNWFNLMINDLSWQTSLTFSHWSYFG